MKSIPYPGPENGFLSEHIQLLCSSYLQLLNKPLLQDEEDGSLSEKLFYAPIGLVSHNSAKDPVFNYANLTAMTLFELSWREFTALPSRMSAEPVNQEERMRLLATVTEKGFIENYQGIRISASGKRFEIRNAVVWNLVDEQGFYHGQAACFKDWEFLQGI